MKPEVLQKPGGFGYPMAVLGFAGILGCIALWSLTTGSAQLTYGEAVSALLEPGEAFADIVIWQVRLPRLLAAAATGAALAVAGAIMQAVTGNPLAEPGLLGVNAGAAFLVVVAISVTGVNAAWQLQWIAFGGSAGAALLVFTLAAGGRRGPTPIRLVLSGVIIATFLGALTAAVLILDAQTFDTVRFWTAGSVKGRELAQILQVLPGLVLALGVALLLGHQFTTLSLGGEQARALGQNPALWRSIAAACVVGLAGSAVSIAGPVGFVGLVVPHMVRMVIGSDYLRLLPLAALGGAVLVLLADTAPRALLGTDLPVGITMAFVGAPFFIWLARRHGAVRG